MKQSLTTFQIEDEYTPVYNIELEAILWWDSLNQKGKDAAIQKYCNSPKTISRNDKEIIPLYLLVHNQNLF